ncbi:MAG: OmpH family outer membrane protein [Fretibacterium sp.]|nr:OmpH family outer membrane protein [Fretibacterium sp.]
MKKLILLGAFVFFAALMAGPVFAAPAAPVDSVGLVDMFGVVSQHPRIEEVNKELANISRQKENEAKAAADKESDPAKKAQAVQTKRMEFAREEQRLMEPIYKDCQQAVRKVAVDKKLSLVINKSAVLIGGIDITQDVVQELRKASLLTPKK